MEEFPALNFDAPVSHAVLQAVSGSAVLCTARKKAVVLQPEEWVRQHWLHYLKLANLYPESLTAVERKFTINGRVKRFDILVFDKSGNPFLLVELKEPDVEINQKVFNQVFAYNLALKCPHLLVSNGLQHFVFEVSGQGQIEQKSSLPQLPA